MLVLIMGDVICASRNAWVIGSNETELSHRSGSEAALQLKLH